MSTSHVDNILENVDEAVFKYLRSTEMSPELRTAVMNMFMELFEKEANETVDVLGESRLLFKAELSDYNLEQESLKHEARVHEEKRKQEELEYQERCRLSKLEEQARPKSRTLAQIRNERVQARAVSRNDSTLSSKRVNVTGEGQGRPVTSRKSWLDDESYSGGYLSGERPSSRNYRHEERSSRSNTPDYKMPFSTRSSGEPVISQEKLKQESEAILSGMQAVENRQLQERRRHQEEIQKRRKEKLEARNKDLESQAKAILDRALEVSQANASNKEQVDLKLQARLDNLKRSKDRGRGIEPTDDDIEEILA